MTTLFRANRLKNKRGLRYYRCGVTCVARSIQECLPENSIAMRIGGDEFLIMCACCSSEKVTQIVDSIRQKLRKYSDEVLKLSASFGTCTVETSDISFKNAYNTADRAMYEEKQQHHKRNLNI